MSDSDSSKESHEGGGDKAESENAGNRDNLVNTLARVCTANGYKRGAVFVDNEFNEVQLISQPPKPRPDSWVLDDSLDDIASPQKLRDYEKLRPPSTTTGPGVVGTLESGIPEHRDTFATQQQTFDKFREHAEKRFSLRTKAITVLAVGGHGSGKSYTLFGGSNRGSRGLVPRAIEYLFDDPRCSLRAASTSTLSHLLLSMYLVDGETFVDLLAAGSGGGSGSGSPTFAPIRHSHEANLVYSKALGPLPLPVQPVCTQTSKQALTALALGLQTAAVYLATRADFFSAGASSLVVTLTCLCAGQPDTAAVTRLTFIEAPAMATPAPQLPPSIDRLTGTSLQYVAARALNSVGKSKKKRPGEASFAGTPAQQHFSEYSKSVLNSLLQDALFKCPDVLMIGCVRGTVGLFEDNFAALDLMNRVDVLSGSLSSTEDMSALSLNETVAQLEAEARACAEAASAAKAKEEEEAMVAEAEASGLTREALQKRKEKERLLAKAEAKGKPRAAGSGSGGPGAGRTDGGGGGGKRRVKSELPSDLFAPVPLASALAHKGRHLARLADGLAAIVVATAAAAEAAVAAAAAAQAGAEKPSSSQSRSRKSKSGSSSSTAAGVSDSVLGRATAAAAAASHNVEAFFNLREPFQPPFDPSEIEPLPPPPPPSQSSEQTDNEERATGQASKSGAGKAQGLQQQQQQLLMQQAASTAKERKARLASRASLSGVARWLDPQATAPFDVNLAAWLRLHGLEVRYAEEPVLLQGAEFKAAQSARLALEAKLAECELLEPGSGNGETLGLTFGSPWTEKCESLDPYLLLLSPASGLAEHFSKVALPLGQVLLRGQSGNLTCSAQVAASSAADASGAQVAPPSVVFSHNFTFSPAAFQEDPEAPPGGRSPTFFQCPASPDQVQARDKAAFASALDVCIGNFLFPHADDRAEATRKGSRFRQMAIPGPGVAAIHAILTTAQPSVVRVRPAFTLDIAGDRVYSFVAVNGQAITDEVTLQDQDVIQLGHARFVQVRIPAAPLSFKKTGGALGDERRSDLTLWEWSMVKAFGRQLRAAVERAERNRRHITHLDVNREVAAVTKTDELTALMKIQSFDPPMQIVAAVYAAISAFDRAYLCTLIGAAGVVAQWSAAMRRNVRIEFQLQALSPKDVMHKGRVIRVGAHVIAAASAAAAGAGEASLQNDTATREQYRNDYERREAEKLRDELDNTKAEDDEDEGEAMMVPAFGQAQPRRRKALMRTMRSQASDGAEAAVEDRLYCGQLMCSLGGVGVGGGIGGGGGGDGVGGAWWWSAPMLVERLGLVQCMMHDFNSAWCSRDTSFLDALYPPERDPFQDTVGDELVGVGFLYLDSLQYLLDIDDCVPLTSLSGHRVGACRVRCRAWIDKVEPAPAYLSVDKERTLEEFVGKTLVLRLYFEFLQDLPPSLCASTFVNFKFFYHSKPYRTARHGGVSVNPYLNAVVRIDQKITMDFIDFIRRGSLEIEVFGKRKEPPGGAGRLWGGADGFWGLRTGEFVEPYVPPRPKDSEGGGDDGLDLIAEEQNLVEGLKREIEDLTADLQAAERQLVRASKMSDAAQEETLKLKNSIQKHADHAAKLNSEIAKHKEHIAQVEQKYNNKKASKACVIC